MTDAGASDTLREQDGRAPAGPARAAKLAQLVSDEPLLHDEVVLLTGAAGGIGEATATLLAAAGARLMLTDIDGHRLARVADRLARGGAEVRSEAMDAANPEAFGRLQRRTEDELGSVFGLVNCAGLFEPAPFVQLGPAAWQAALRANLDTAYCGCRAVLPALMERGRGSVVNFASTAGEYGSIRPAAHYAAAKGAIVALTKSLAREAGPSGVRVNCLSPGPIATSGLNAVTPEAQAEARARTLLGRAGQAEEVAAACVFLLSDLASFMTGHVLQVNGGALV